MHDTFIKGNIALTKVIADLVEKGFHVLQPIQEQLPYDLVVFKDGVFKRIQVKYDGGTEFVFAHNRKYVWYKKTTKAYDNDSFDYYAIYCAAINTIIYPSIGFGGASFRLTTPNAATPYYKFEDFLEFTDSSKKHVNQSVDWDKHVQKRHGIYTPKKKVEWPTKDALEKLVWENPTTKIAKNYGVSDKAVAKWCKIYGISKPSRGYWKKQNGRRTESSTREAQLSVA